MGRALWLSFLLLPLAGCVQATSHEVGVVEEFTRPDERPIPRPPSSAARRALEAEWPPATGWEPPPEDEFRIRPVYRRAGLASCRTARPDRPCQAEPPRRRRHRRRVFDAGGTDAVILRVRRTGRHSPPVIRLTRNDD